MNILLELIKHNFMPLLFKQNLCSKIDSIFMFSVCSYQLEMRSSFIPYNHDYDFVPVCCIILFLLHIKTRSFDKQPWKLLRELQAKFLFTSISMYVSNTYSAQKKLFKGCKGIISVLYLQTIELIDNRKLKQIDS